MEMFRTRTILFEQEQKYDATEKRSPSIIQLHVLYKF